MKRFWLYVLLVLFSGCPLVVPAYPLDVAIEGPTYAAPGDLVVLTAKAEGSTNRAWVLANADKTYLPVEEGWKTIFSSGLPEGAKSVTYIFVLSASDSDSLGIAKHSLTIALKPPGPDPEPDPEPDPDEDPAPIKEPGFRVLIVYESEKLTEEPWETQAIIAGADVRNFLDANCVKINGQPQYRIYDPDVNIGGDLEVWKQAITRERTELPWVVISNGKTGFEGPLPKTPTAFLELCKKYLPAK